MNFTNQETVSQQTQNKLHLRQPFNLNSHSYYSAEGQPYAKLISL